MDEIDPEQKRDDSDDEIPEDSQLPENTDGIAAPPPPEGDDVVPSHVDQWTAEKRKLFPAYVQQYETQAAFYAQDKAASIELNQRVIFRGSRGDQAALISAQKKMKVNITPSDQEHHFSSPCLLPLVFCFLYLTTMQ